MNGSFVPERMQRWLVLAAGSVLIASVGWYQAWSVFRDPLCRLGGWTVTEVTWAFALSQIIAFGIGAFLGGLWVTRNGPRCVVVIGGIIHGVGVALASLFYFGLWELYLSYGLISGLGRGLLYPIPFAAVFPWFPQRQRGVVAGVLSVAFGGSTLVVAPLATFLITRLGVEQTFVVLGIGATVLSVLAALGLKVPPPGYQPLGAEPAVGQSSRVDHNYTLKEALREKEFRYLWVVCIALIMPGNALLSQVAAMAQEITKVSPLQAAGLVSVMGIGGLFGRMLWSIVPVGRRWLLVYQIVVQVIALIGLATASTFAVFSLWAVLLYATLAGAAASVPTTVVAYYGTRFYGEIQGLLMTYVAVGSLIGPMVIAIGRDMTGTYGGALYVIAAMLVPVLVLPFLMRDPGHEEEQ